MKTDLGPPQAARRLPLPLPFTPTTWRPGGDGAALHAGKARPLQAPAGRRSPGRAGPGRALPAAPRPVPPP